MKLWISAGALFLMLVTVAAAGHGDAYRTSQLPAPPPDDIVISGDLDTRPTTREPRAGGVAIGINGLSIFEIRTPAAGFTIAERERIVYMRLIEVISYTNVADESIYSIRSIRGKPTIYIGNYRFITVYPRDAAAAGIDSMALAREWMAALHTVLPQVAPWSTVSASML